MKKCYLGGEVGEANQVTMEVNRILMNWLDEHKDTLRASLRDYEMYKIQVDKPCGRHKFQKYHSYCKKGFIW